MENVKPPRMEDEDRRRSAKPGREFLLQVLIFHGVGMLFVALVALLWFASDALLLVFAGILLAILLCDATRRLRRWVPLSHGVALTAVVLLTFAVLGLGGWAMAPGAAEQAGELVEAIPKSLQRLQASLERYGVIQKMMGSLPSPETIVSQASSVVARAGVFFSGVLGAIANLAIIVVLGILAGLLDFIPYIGPILAAVPAVLIAFSESPMLALYVALLFIGLQAAEGYLLLPLIERRTVSLPPALTIIMQILLGAFFGLAGVALATPLTAVLAVLITMLYVQDVLGDQVSIPGEHSNAE